MISDWNQFFRDVAVNYFLNNTVQLGSPGCVVEINKSFFAHRKYNCGRIVEGQWIFGGYEPTTKEGFLIPVAQCDAAAL